jgi:cytochrome bd ubiquinol oxidase subunit II
MDLNSLWFILVTVLFVGFFFLEGFDYGVGMLMPFLGKADHERRAILNTIGPVWESNEVWMVVAGGALFASFPDVYATLFSGFYLALILMLVALIVRGVGLEFRSKIENLKWRRFWDWMIFSGSLLPALLWGVAVANLMRGFAIDQDMNYFGGLLPLLNPYALLGGLLFVALFVYHGGNFLALKAPKPIAERMGKITFASWIVTLVLCVGFVIWTFISTDILTKTGVNGLVPAILAAIALGAAGVLARGGKLRWSFVCSALTIILVTIMVFTGLYPRILISSLNPDYSLTIENASSSAYTLRVMTIVAIIFIPIVLAYVGWTYWIFRRRVDPDAEKLIY